VNVLEVAYREHNIKYSIVNYSSQKKSQKKGHQMMSYK